MLTAPVQAARRLVHTGRRRAREGGRPAVFRTLRLTAAAVIAFAIAIAIYPGSRPMTAPLTAVLVTQATLFSTLTIGVKRLGAVVSGVVLAVLFSSFVGLTWWSLGTVIAGAILVGYLLRLQEFLLETPISAMLVLGLTSPETLATDRVIQTLVGAGVGMLLNVVFPPPWRVRDAATSVRVVADSTADFLARVAGEVPEQLTREAVREWLDECRRLSRPVERADQALVEAAESRRLNVRAAGTHDPQPILRSGLDALERAIVSLRALFRALADSAPDEERGDEPPYAEDLRQIFAALLDDLASTFRAYGRLVVVGAGPEAGEAEEAMGATLESLRETRARLSDLLTVDAPDAGALWLLRGPLLASVERVLTDLDVEERARRRRRWEDASGNLSRPRQAALRLRASSRHVAELQRGAGQLARERARRRWRRSR
ncbi:MAG TPA: aromatic acid exporter family protein [Segeticoccus sp.]|nr:aromatic acid exporter family protein [Segeticoccus sp.]